MSCSPSMRNLPRLMMSLALALACAVACFPEGFPAPFKASTATPDAGSGGGAGEGGTAGEGGDAGSAQGFVCRPVETPEPLAAREGVISAEAGSGSQVVFVNDLFQSFRAHCGGCHVDGAQGGFKVTAGDFARTVDRETLEFITSDDPDKPYMPPPPTGKPWSERTDDGVTKLVELLRAWIDAGRPTDVFLIEASGGGESPFLMTPEVGTALTNLGNCLPSTLLYVGPKSDELDERFAALEKSPPGQGSPEERLGLPKTLDETDLFTFDSAVLAQHGVIAYAPTYPLWSDGSGKLRHVRVPKGESIRYDRQKREFFIPDNTRFYKTFLKKVIDENGEERFRKIETRVIVVRQDSESPDGTARVNSLFGTYAWNEDETSAELVTDPLRNGEPFRDRVFTYITDQPGADAVYSQQPRPPNIAFALELAGVTRHYAIPGSDRCVQCHMGSPSKSFVLGFTPLQLHRLLRGVQGVFEDTSEDELGQLRRLVDYGVVTGMDPEEDVVLLEDSQGDRKPRNAEELTAQAYMLGNCAHCHNPRGYPSVINPALAPLLDFWPSETGGIFQFPLDRFSPRTTRGLSGEVPIPYITPSLRDIVSSNAKPKYVASAAATPYVEFVDAPWRSLIYRNVDTPFTYADDFAVFPHMPMSTAGFDCRAPRILGEWMVSIPAERVHPELVESSTVTTQVDNTPQPYVEVRPGDENYEAARSEAAQRLSDYKNGERYGFCPDTSDVTDPAVLRGQITVPKDEELYVFDEQGENPNPRFVDPKLVMIQDGVPDRAHFVVSDFTEPPGDWYPRRSDWVDVLRDEKFPPAPSDPAAQNAQLLEKKVVSILKGVTLTPELVDYALTERPMGFWKPKQDCDFSGQRQLGDLEASEREPWMTCENAPEDVPCDEAPLFEELPGATIFTAICSNCHGRNLDAEGIQSKTVADLTGGVARVANFRTGLFGPRDAPGDNRERVFGEVAGNGVTSDEWAARYLAWMALGGTTVKIPDTVLTLVARTPVLGHARKGLAITASANMLAVAQELCRYSLPNPSGITASASWDDLGPGMTAFYDPSWNPVLTQIGDLSLWLEVCSLGNPKLVRVLYVDQGKVEIRQEGFISQNDYPNGLPVGNHRLGIEDGIQGDNAFPWCINDDAQGQTFAATHQLGGKNLPLCPATTLGVPQGWLERAAINAGLMVYLYVDQVTKGEVEPRYYDRCEDLE